MAKAEVPGWLPGLALIFLSALVLVIGTNAVHLRPDENLVYDYTRSDWRYLVTYLAEHDSHPPLWFSSFWLWRQLVGDSEFAGRLLAAFYSLIALALVYQIGYRWFGAPRYGLFAIALLSVNAFFFVHALEIRPYGLILLLVTASMWTFQRWLVRQTGRAALFYALTLGAMLYVHYFLFVLMLAQALYFVLLRPSWRLIRQGAHVAIMAFLIWLPWLPFAFYQVLNVRRAEMIGGNARGLIGAGSTTQPTSLSAVLNLAHVATNGQVVLYALLVLIGAVFLWRRAAYRLALVWALGVPAVSLLVNLVVAVYLPRYVVYMVIGLALLVAAGLAQFPRYARWPALVAVAVVSLWFLPASLPASRVPLRDLYQQVSAAAGPDDVIFFDSGGWGDGFVRAQIRRYLDPDLLARRVQSIEEAVAQRRVWYVTDDEWRSDATRARFEQIERSHPLQQIIGRCDRDWCYLLQLLEAPPNPEPVIFGETLAFRGVDLDAVTGEAVKARLWWTVDEPVPLDYSIGLHVLDSTGRLVAQSDGPIIDLYSGQPVQSSQMQPDRIYIDARRVVLPSDLPGGNYQLALAVYQSWDGARLLLPDGTDYLLLDSIYVNRP
ncbi:MAG TPA: glycosyltransferase family 39 protein [Spirillospora sp.]|nr:glycosyltransferase family 39 protein [Spirillospora sp.]